MVGEAFFDPCQSADGEDGADRVVCHVLFIRFCVNLRCIGKLSHLQ